MAVVLWGRGCVEERMDSVGMSNLIKTLKIRNFRLSRRDASCPGTRLAGRCQGPLAFAAQICRTPTPAEIFNNPQLLLRRNIYNETHALSAVAMRPVPVSGRSSRRRPWETLPHATGRLASTLDCLNPTKHRRALATRRIPC